MYKFKTNLMASKKYWNDWFIGLTKSFLSIKVPKTLMLAGIERMDKDLTIAQMQGKYKLSFLKNVLFILCMKMLLIKLWELLMILFILLELLLN